MPKGCSDDEFPWNNNHSDWLNSKYPYGMTIIVDLVCHAEMNAILNKNSIEEDGLTIYTTLFPCNECAKLIIQSSITEVVYLKMRNDIFTTAALRLFKSAKVTHRFVILFESFF
ncbi:deoxycytidylate deaminase-like [Octopus sinensis]|uniref:dCMP deaminase n=1 Tax=Octopus sinensis TaxID=2607531 RepID=A0A7E6EHV4_9MOLL|nr:deoxycytidylate deaminase-like [Octopus sinensis]